MSILSHLFTKLWVLNVPCSDLGTKLKIFQNFLTEISNFDLFPKSYFLLLNYLILSPNWGSFKRHLAYSFSKFWILISNFDPFQNSYVICPNCQIFPKNTYLLKGALTRFEIIYLIQFSLSLSPSLPPLPLPPPPSPPFQLPRSL